MDELLDTFADSVATSQPDELFEALEAFCRDLIGVELFSCSRFDLEAGRAERIYTNDPVAYPLSGLKDIVPNRWTEIVLDRRQPFLARGIEDLRDVFPDHAKIEALGWGSAINYPVLVANRFLGTVNLLHTEGYYSEESLALLPRLCLPAAVAFLAGLRI